MLVRKSKQLMEVKTSDTYGRSRLLIRTRDESKFGFVRLEEIGKFQSGGTPSKAHLEYFGGNIPWITTVALNGGIIDENNAVDYLTKAGVDNSATKIVPPYALMIGTRVGVGKVAVNTVAMCTNQDIISVTNIELSRWKLDYLRYVIQSKSSALNSQARGATIKGIKLDVLQKVEIPNIPLKDQETIVSKLSLLQSAICGRKKQIEQLDILVKARFIELFGDPAYYRDDWRSVELGTCCELNPKKTSDARLNDNLSVSFIPMPAVSEDGDIDTSEIRQYSEVKSGFTYFQERDVLFAKITPCMENGKGAVAQNLFNGIGFGSTEFHVLRPKDQVSNPYWIHTLLSFENVRKDAEANMTGSAGQRRVPASFLKTYKVVLPTIEKQTELERFVLRVDKSKVAKEPYRIKNNQPVIRQRNAHTIKRGVQIVSEIRRT